MALTHQKKYGQYFTTNADLKQKVFDFILNQPSVILEPSIGRGDLVAYVQERIPFAHFDMYEIDNTIDFLASIDREKIHFGDFLLHHFSFETPTLEGVLSDNGDTFSALEMRKGVTREFSQTSYKTIIGNPPYIRTQKSKKNQYIRFIEKCFDLLEVGMGELIFIVPSDFFQLTSALPILSKMMSSGTFTHIYYPNNERLFENASIDVIVFRYCKNPDLEKTVLYNDEIRRILYDSSGAGSSVQFSPILSPNNQKQFVKDVFDVFVGMVSGKDEVFKHTELGNISVLSKEGQREKFIFIDSLSSNNKDQDLDQVSTYLESKKTELISRRIRKFNDNNWFEWGAPRNITTILRHWGQPCIYMSNLTRDKNIAFLGKVEYFGGGLLLLLPKPGTSISQLEEIITHFNSSEFQENYRFSGRFKIGQRQLSYSSLPF
jgi:adenine-specific DNA-methyltransferase